MTKTNRSQTGKRPLDEKALDGVAGGTDVKIDQMTTTVNSTGGSGGLGSTVMGAIVKDVVKGIKGSGRPG